MVTVYTLPSLMVASGGTTWMDLLSPVTEFAAVYVADVDEANTTVKSPTTGLVIEPPTALASKTIVPDTELEATPTTPAVLPIDLLLRVHCGAALQRYCALPASSPFVLEAVVLSGFSNLIPVDAIDVEAA